ncbi:GtrA family protein [Olivibacter sp. SDN3]|uniref:GtrA family protein n=1 Tax=Olivibacter sp. SDN3 TaxID=2764720 RepID=UPI00165159E4|nr:GtrA family protein [Olivibacter sp. SDN3]QNL49069.1 GtrA family protein [Olivibacter sp. SDN3]
MNRRNNIYTFIKAQLSAFIGGIVDYLIMIGSTEYLQIHYTVSILLGGIVGALANFTINRNWTFEGTTDAASTKMGFQLLKFAIIVGVSILLKAMGTYLVTEGGRIDYRISRVMVDLMVSLGFNYTLQKYWVFKRT